jgi:2-keto-4-pentenoate hydratase/2-oxohepta-3-ene-1,7-dioic acid hydratase in catechol pathway
MRLCRFGDDRLGLVEGDIVRDVTVALDVLSAHRYPLPNADPLIVNLERLRPRLLEVAKLAPAIPVRELAFFSPVANPGKIVAAPVNYKKHIDEARVDPGIHFQKQISTIEQAGLFLKATSSVVGPSQGVAIRHSDRRNDHEVELGVVIGKPADRVSRDEALDHVAAYCIGLDMTVRGPEDRSLRKSVDSYTVLGPWMVTADEIADPANLDLSLTVNGELRQSSNTRELIFDIGKLISWASSFYTLMPGDVLLTGTPEGVGPVVPGDVIEATVEGIGSMKVAVRAA